MTSKQFGEHIRDILSPWCRCICTVAPDGTMCKLCGHAHEPPSEKPTLRLEECTFCGSKRMCQFTSKEGVIVAYCEDCRLLIKKDCSGEL